MNCHYCHKEMDCLNSKKQPQTHFSCIKHWPLRVTHIYDKGQIDTIIFIFDFDHPKHIYHLILSFLQNKTRLTNPTAPLNNTLLVELNHLVPVTPSNYLQVFERLMDLKAFH